MNSLEVKNGLMLGAAAAAAILVIVVAFELTRDAIRTTEQQNLQAQLVDLLTPNSFDNTPALDSIYLSDPALGTDMPRAIYRARNKGVPAGAVIASVAPNGYNGDIELLVGLTYDGDVVGVRVTKHNETPGLGDDIEVARSNWIHSFNNWAFKEIKPQTWRVKKDGGQFDQFTGATITPRAIVASVYEVVLWYQQNREAVFIEQTNPNSTAE